MTNLAGAIPHNVTVPTQPMTLNDWLWMSALLLVVIISVVVGLMLASKLKANDEQQDDGRKYGYADDWVHPWKPNSGGGKGIEPIDLMRWFEPDNPMIQSRVPHVEVAVLEKERERVTV